MPVAESQQDAPLPLGTRLAGRFTVRMQLGAGAFGRVYAAEDDTREGLVAIKHLTKATGANIYRFKREFRTLAGRNHPNLVRLDELFSDGGQWFFSMELVRGEHFDTWVRGQHSTLHDEDPSTIDDGPPRPGRASAETAAAPDLGRLRAALNQLVGALNALHEAGVIHRDLKPANVIVTAEGRLVVLDFGLAVESDLDAQQSALGLVLGTPSYMSPEQALGRAATEASDWYSVGVMLFEALYGRPPFHGTSQDVLTAKVSGPPRWPAPLEGAADLEDLYRALLKTEPRERPTGSELAARVRPTASAAGTLPRAPGHAASTPFVGRETELRALRSALHAVGPSRTVMMRVRGQSGVGKSALVRHFLASLGPDVVVLNGRCFERESVPYKTLDGVVDSLTRYLTRLSVAEASLLVPREAQALCRLFPVFARLRLVADQPERQRSSSPHEERRRGFAALREVLARIGDRRRLVISIDDLQWGDADSIEPLKELLVGTDPPRLLLLVAFRSNDKATSPALEALRSDDFASSIDDVRDLDVGPLAEDDAAELARRLLPPQLAGRATELARESGGIPFFVPELVRAQQQARSSDEPVSFERAIQRRITALSAGTRRLLEVVAVAGRPLPRRIAGSAAGLDDQHLQTALLELHEQSFVRSAAAEDSLVETFHDRIREAVVASLPEDALRHRHVALATAFEGDQSADPEALAEHYRLAGELARARPAAITAAERATDAFAFERAIALYRAAQQDAPSGERRLLTSRLGDVLAYAGRGRDAAAAYLEAVPGAPPSEARELRRRAAEQLLRCGAIDDGLVLIRALLQEVGLPFPESKASVLASVLAQKALLALRRLSFQERVPGPKDVDEVSRVDLCWTVGACLSPVDVVRATDYQTRHLRYALDLGEPSRIARGFALEAILQAVEGGNARQRAEKLSTRASEIAARIDNGHAMGWALASLAVVDWSAARWRRALERAREAIRVLRARCPESVWEVALLEVWFKNRTLLFLGEVEEFIAEAKACTRGARERGDQLTLTTSLSATMVHVHLIADMPDDGRRASADGIAGWVKGDWHFQHQEDLRAQILCDLYEGDPRRALERVDEHWTALKRSLLLRAENERIQSFSLFAAAAIHARDARVAERWLGALEKETNPWARALAAALRAGVLALRAGGDASTGYEQAAVQLESLDMPLLAASCRRRRGELIAGAEGERLVASVDAILGQRGIKAPGRWARTMVP